MKYYRLCQDRRIPYSVLLTNLNNIGGYYESKGGNLSLLDKTIVSFVNSSPINFYPDILDRQIFMIKDAVKEVFDLFMPELEYKHCCLLDNPNNRHELYFIPVLDLVDMSKNSTKGTHIFRLKDTREIEVIISLEVVEAILRRKSAGIRISPV